MCLFLLYVHINLMTVVFEICVSEQHQKKKMCPIFEILVGIFTLILVFLLFTRYGFKPKKFPPGPPRIPVIGSLPFLPTEVKKGQKKSNGARKYLKQPKSSQSGVTQHFVKNYIKLLKF